MARLSRPGWLLLNTKSVYPWTVTHPCTNRARRRATTLIKTNALPLSQAATRKRVPKTCCTADNWRRIKCNREYLKPLSNACLMELMRTSQSAYSTVIEWFEADTAFSYWQASTDSLKTSNACQRHSNTHRCNRLLFKQHAFPYLPWVRTGPQKVTRGKPTGICRGRIFHGGISLLTPINSNIYLNWMKHRNSNVQWLEKWLCNFFTLKTRVHLLQSR